MEQGHETTRRQACGTCALCERETQLTFHHLIPRSQHRRAAIRRSTTAEQRAKGINICRPCHRGIHRLIDEQTLARDHATLAALLAHDGVRRHVAWVARQRVARPAGARR